MSRYMQKNIHGEWEEIVEDKDQCRYLIDEVCCNADCDQCADFPDPEEYCPKCEHFTPEEEQ